MSVIISSSDEMRRQAIQRRFRPRDSEWPVRVAMLRFGRLLLAAIVSCWLTVTGASAQVLSMDRIGPASVQSTAFGPVLATPEGQTLYWWPRDETTPGKSQCTDERFSSYRHVTGAEVYFPRPDSRGSCADKWPPFTAPEGAEPVGDWSLISREDGARQWAYRGKPLHTSIKDGQPGEVNGLSVTVTSYGGWEPAMAPLGMPPGVKLRRTVKGVILTTDNDVPLYRKACTDCPQAALTPLLAAAMMNPGGDWSVSRGSGGIHQYSYQGQAVYQGREPLRGISGSRLSVPEGWEVLLYQPAVALPAAVESRFSLIGDIYTNRQGMALYVFYCESGKERLPCDDPGDAAAYWSVICSAPATCADLWQPFTAGPDARASGEWSIVEVPHPVYHDPLGLTYEDGNPNPRVRQWAYRGRPVYTYTEDLEPAQILGHRINALPGAGFYAIRVPGNDDPALAR